MKCILPDGSEENLPKGKDGEKNGLKSGNCGKERRVTNNDRPVFKDYSNGKYKKE